ncbi:N-acetylmuramoyl-L-alanine amidase [Gracilibacillus marinus]|uniref:N-acetylmuramoyl-L-alanine amidase n=1 Tax=Gracilibacillus marinus TaxID=630535 RepID=A0ABV8VWX3_9BACI
MTKIYIDAGHGGTDPGAVGNGLREKDLTLAISKKIKDLLNDYDNTQVKLSRTSDKTLSLNQRTDDANAWGADLLVSVHINAGGGQGYEDFTYNGQYKGKERTTAYQNIINDEVVKATGFSNRGKKQANFHMVRESTMPAILTENGFIDNRSDADKLKSDAFINKIAQGHVNGIVKIFGLKKKSVSKPSASKSIEQLAQEVIAGKHGTGNARKKALGSQYEAVQKRVNEILLGGSKPKKSISQMATEVIQGNHGNGHDNRRKSLGISQAEYNKVRAEVNKRL